MAEAEGGDGGIPDDSPNPMVLMGDILDKLKILGYEEFARKKLEGRLLHAAYFVVPHPKPSEQFHYFKQIFAFLMRQNNFSFEAPEEFDDYVEDPNTTVANMIEALRRARISFDYSQAKVRQGYGEAVCVVLNLLCDGALASRGFRVAPIEYPTDVYPEEAPIDDDEEVSADIADTVAATAEEEEDEDYQHSRAEVKKEETKETKIIESTIDPNAWKEEVEKVAPLLKMRAELDNKEWRTHLEHTKELQDNIEGKVPMVKENLSKLAGTIATAIEEIGNREKRIGTQYKKEVQEYLEVQEQLQEVMKRFEERNREVSTLGKMLGDISEELDSIKSQSDERGESMTDTGPLVRLKDAMKKIKKEIKEMDLRIGTVSHNLLHIKMAQGSDNTKKKKYQDEDEDDDD